MAEAYAEIALPPRTYSEGDYWDVERVRSSRARLYEIFRSSYLDGDPPFAPPKAPYEGYRAFDLREHASSEERDKSVILLVDIHT